MNFDFFILFGSHFEILIHIFQVIPSLKISFLIFKNDTPYDPTACK